MGKSQTIRGTKEQNYWSLEWATEGQGSGKRRKGERFGQEGRERKGAWGRNPKVEECRRNERKRAPIRNQQASTKPDRDPVKEIRTLFQWNSSDPDLNLEAIERRNSWSWLKERKRSKRQLWIAD